MNLKKVYPHLFPNWIPPKMGIAVNNPPADLQEAEVDRWKADKRLQGECGQIYSESLWSRNFHNLKLRQHGVEIWQFVCHSDFTWNQILVNSDGQKCHFWNYWRLWILLLVILSHFSSPNFCQNSKLRVSEILKMVIFEVQILPNWFHAKLSVK